MTALKAGDKVLRPNATEPDTIVTMVNHGATGEAVGVKLLTPDGLYLWRAASDLVKVEDQ
jgi:hypothetical protein